MAVYVTAVCDAMALYFDRPFGFFGHSLGSLAAYVTVYSSLFVLPRFLRVLLLMFLLSRLSSLGTTQPFLSDTHAPMLKTTGTRWRSS